MIGAGSVVNKDVPDNSIVVGNPAKVINTLDNYIEKNKELMKTAPVYHTYWTNKTSEEKEEMHEQLKGGIIGFDI